MARDGGVTMKEYSVEVKWDHKGNRYPVRSYYRTKASRMSTAVFRILNNVKEANPKNFREPKGATVRIHVTVLGDSRRENSDGRGNVLPEEAES